MNTQQSKCRRHAFSYLLIVVPALLFMISACGEKPVSDSTSGTGSISFGLAWQRSGDYRTKTKSPSGDICVDYKIEWINATLKNSTNDIVAEKRWSCSDHHGVIGDLQPASGMTLDISGEVAAEASWLGQATGISVASESNTDLGMVDMTYFDQNEPPPEVEILLAASGITEFPLNVHIPLKFSKQIVAASITPDSIILLEEESGKTITCSLDYDDATLTCTVVPEALEPYKQYTLNISGTIEDIHGFQLGADQEWTFQTSATTAQVLVWDTGNWDETVWQ